MSDTDPPAAIPWYQSNVMRGIVAGAVAQVIARAESRFGVHLIPGADVEIVSWIMDGISAAAIWYTAHARVTQKAAPAVVLTKQKAEDLNTAAKAAQPGDPK